MTLAETGDLSAVSGAMTPGTVDKGTKAPAQQGPRDGYPVR